MSRDDAELCGLAASVTALLVICVGSCWAQNGTPDPSDTRTQYPPLLANSYFGLGVAMIDTPFTARQLQPGFSATQIDTPAAGVSVALFGHRFGQYFAAEVDYSRPLRWASFNNLNGSGLGHSVWVALGEFKGRARLPITDRLAIYGDAGVAITSRHGAKNDDGTVVVGDAHYLAPLSWWRRRIRAQPSMECAGWVHAQRRQRDGRCNRARSLPAPACGITSIPRSRTDP